MLFPEHDRSAWEAMAWLSSSPYIEVRQAGGLLVATAKLGTRRLVPRQATFARNEIARSSSLSV
jgi:hypothetical protein